MAEAFSPSRWIVASTRRSIHAASAEPGDRGRLLGCERELHFLTLISAERVQEGSHCGRSGLRLCVGCDFSNGPSRAPSPDQVSAELD
jgi:hypothetical protein